MSSKASSKRRYQPAAQFDDVTLANKREYWRTKKREQRAKKHNRDVSCPLEDANTPIKSFSSGLLVSENNVNTVACQKERWFQRNKLNVIPQCPETSTNSLRDIMSNKGIVRSSVTGSSNTDAITVEHSEPVSPTGLSVPTACGKLHLNSALPQKTTKGMSALNGNQLATSQQSLESVVLPVHNTQNKPQNKNCLPRRPLTSAECKVDEDQSFLGSKSPITNRQTCAFASQRNRFKTGTTGTPMTEDEIAAKRRENWRIKKREQRAKHAAKIAKDSEESLGQGQTSCIDIVHASFPANKALRAINHTSAYPVALNKQSLGFKVEDSQASVAINTIHLVQGTKPNHTSSGVVPQFSSATQTINKCEVQKQIYAQTQKGHCQNQMRKTLLGTSKGACAEDRHARQREYWRIKKREQRAKLSPEVKARMKERDALKHRVKRYHSILNQMRRVQAGCQKAHRSTEDKFLSDSETTGGFIKEDGTITVSISKTNPGTSQAKSHDFPNVKSNGKVKVSIPIYQDALPFPKSPKLVTVKNKPASHNSTNNFSVSKNTRQKFIGHNSSSTSLIKSKLARSTVDKAKRRMTITIQSEQLTEEERVARMREYWRIKKRKQRANRAARFKHGLLKSKISVVKQRRQNQKSTKSHPLMVSPHSKTSSVDSAICDDSTSPPVTASMKQEHIYPSIQAVFSLSEITPCVNVKDGKPSSCPESHSKTEAPDIEDHHATTLQAVASMKKLLEESVSTTELKTESLAKCEDTEINVIPNSTLQQKFNCDIPEDTSHRKDIKLSASPCHFTFQEVDLSSEDTHHNKCPNLSQGVANRSHALTQMVLRPIRKAPHKPSDDRRNPEQCCPPHASQEQRLGENNELQRKREYWRLMKRQQRARKSQARQGSKDSVSHRLALQMEGGRSRFQNPLSAASENPACNIDVSSNYNVHTAVTASPTVLLVRPIILTQQPSNEQRLQLVEGLKGKISEAPQEKMGQTQFLDTSINTCSRTLMQPMTQDTTTCRKKPIQKKTKRCTNPADPWTHLKDTVIGKLGTNQSHIKATPTPEEDSDEIIRRRRMHWRIKKQEQRAKKAARDRELRETMFSDWDPVPSQSASQAQNTTCRCSGSPPSIKTEDQLGQITESCQTELKVEGKSSSALDDDAAEGTLSQSTWRNIYLMDFDPANPLLVCMVCGEQLYSLSVDGVKTHIEEVHPETLSLGDQERQGIVEAWDKQVAMCESFITNQLQQ